MSMLSEEIKLLIAGYVLGDLSQDEADEFERLLAADPAIAAEVAQTQAALEVSYSPPEVMPPASLRSTILATAKQERSESMASEMAASEAPVLEATPSKVTPAGVIPLDRARPQRKRLWRGIIEAAAAAMIVALGIQNYQLRQDLKTAQIETQKYAALTYSLSATKTNSTASAIVVVNPNKLEATVDVKNLPPLPPGKVYALWTVLKPNAPFTVDSKEAVLTEVFAVDDRGNFSQAIVVPKIYRSEGAVAKVAVTIEDANAPQKHTGSPIMITGL